ncbi:MAG: DNA translocase FtsK 4TM domain-containing protein, partial [Desulfobacteraceae bacterium]|nr:DNA translocase FtsK 4TM domain-containing protein [Desulfobacteraceae bacterium]
MAKASNPPEPPAGPSLGQEILAVLGVCLALFLLISLISYSGGEVAGRGLSPIGCGNWGGWLGDLAARILSWGLGLGAFGLVFFLLYLSLQ